MYLWVSSLMLSLKTGAGHISPFSLLMISDSFRNKFLSNTNRNYCHMVLILTHRCTSELITVQHSCPCSSQSLSLTTTYKL